MRTEIIDPNDSQAVTEDTVKEHLRIDGDEENGVIKSFIEAAVRHVEEDINQALITRTLRSTIERIEQCWPTIPEGYTVGPYMPTAQAYIELETRPLISVTSIEYWTKGATDWTTWDASEYTVSRSRAFARIAPATGHAWPTNLREGDALRINYTAGYGTNPAHVPADIRLAVTTLAGHMYTNRGEKEAGIPDLVDSLLQKHRFIQGL